MCLKEFLRHFALVSGLVSNANARKDAQLDKFASHLRAVYGICAAGIAAAFLQAAAYSHSLWLGDRTFMVGLLALTVSAALYACSRFEKTAMASIASMAVSFATLAPFTSFNWLIRNMYYDLQIPFSDPSIRIPFVMFVIVPMVVLATTFPPALRFFRKDDRLPESVI